MSWCTQGLGSWACQKFQAFEVMCTMEKPMYSFQFFSRWHNLSLVYILFNDSGNLSLLSYFLIRFVHSFLQHTFWSVTSHLPTLKGSSASEMLFFPPAVNHILKVAHSGTHHL